MLLLYVDSSLTKSSPKWCHGMPEGGSVEGEIVSGVEEDLCEERRKVEFLVQFHILCYVLCSLRRLIEPLTKTPHLKKILLSRSWSILEKMRKSSMIVLRTIMNVTEDDCRSRTGKNIRKMMLESNLI